MSFTGQKREEIHLYLLEKIGANATDYIEKTTAAFDVSDKTVYLYLKKLTNAGILEKQGRTYTLKTAETSFEFKRSDLSYAGEDRIYKEYIWTHVADLPKNVREIWDYAFTEMMNNAMDHSDAEMIRVYLKKNYLFTTNVLTFFNTSSYEQFCRKLHLNFG